MTNATCGLRGHLSSPSAALEQSLVSRLKRRLDGAGSTLFSLTWKRKATPAGRPYYQLAASARRTSETEFGSWPTPDAGAFNVGQSLETWQARITALKAKGINGNGAGTPLAMAAQMAAWPTPKVSSGDYQYDQNGDKILNLSGAAKLAAWASPQARDYRSESVSPEKRAEQMAQPRGKPLSEEAVTFLSGPTSSGSPAATARPGQLNPDFSRWLMGYSAAHLACAPTEMPSSRKSRPSS